MKKKALLLMLFLMFISTNAYSGSYFHGRISGDVQEGITVNLYKSLCGEDELVGAYTTNSAGYYEFENLADGNYKVVPDNESYNFIPEFHTVQIPNTTFYANRNFTADIPCQGAGNDRFIDNSDGTVTDVCTGLSWLQNPDSCFDTPADHLSATQFSSNIGDGDCGLTDNSNPGDWRVPTLDEFLSLGTEPPYTTQAIDIYDGWQDGSYAQLPEDVEWITPTGPIFAGNGSGTFWTKACNTFEIPVVDDITLCFGVEQSTGYRTLFEKVENNYIWPVRDASPTCANGASFEDNGDGTVTDCRTDLVWLKDAGCGNGLYWDDAMSYADGLNSGECGLTDGSAEGDWHLATIYELQGIGTDPPTSWYPFPTPSVTWTMPGAPFQAVLGKIDSFQFYYWSSTEEVGNTAGAWVTQMNDGFSYPADKEPVGITGHAWPVRSAN
jgi:hypothetical protein